MCVGFGHTITQISDVMCVYAAFDLQLPHSSKKTCSVCQLSSKGRFPISRMNMRVFKGLLLGLTREIKLIPVKYFVRHSQRLFVYDVRTPSSSAAVAPLKLASDLMSLLQSTEIFSGLEVAMRGGKKTNNLTKKEVHFIEIGHKA